MIGRSKGGKQIPIGSDFAERSFLMRQDKERLGSICVGMEHLASIRIYSRTRHEWSRADSSSFDSFIGRLVLTTLFRRIRFGISWMIRILSDIKYSRINTCVLNAAKHLEKKCLFTKTFCILLLKQYNCCFAAYEYALWSLLKIYLLPPPLH